MKSKEFRQREKVLDFSRTYRIMPHNIMKYQIRFKLTLPNGEILEMQRLEPDKGHSEEEIQQVQDSFVSLFVDGTYLKFQVLQPSSEKETRVVVIPGAVLRQSRLEFLVSPSE